MAAGRVAVATPARLEGAAQHRGRRRRGRRRHRCGSSTVAVAAGAEEAEPASHSSPRKVFLVRNGGDRQNIFTMPPETKFFTWSELSVGERRNLLQNRPCERIDMQDRNVAKYTEVFMSISPSEKPPRLFLLSQHLVLTRSWLGR